ncbi:hypothetical protein BB560_001510 [Smittium megazygosporum]|uniref:Uncharacterized protein n=1 Tax=Smittium megazygosporum TaxID=133381 RepID=A0A2T9ZHE5_9FUNG|nr:hypothetical protein BB560_001510 [Smittium megazygosporum]
MDQSTPLNDSGANSLLALLNSKSSLSPTSPAVDSSKNTFTFTSSPGSSDPAIQSAIPSKQSPNPQLGTQASTFKQLLSLSKVGNISMIPPSQPSSSKNSDIFSILKNSTLSPPGNTIPSENSADNQSPIDQGAKFISFLKETQKVRASSEIPSSKHSPTIPLEKPGPTNTFPVLQPSLSPKSSSKETTPANQAQKIPKFETPFNPFSINLAQIQNAKPIPESQPSTTFSPPATSILAPEPNPQDYKSPELRRTKKKNIPYGSEFIQSKDHKTEPIAKIKSSTSASRKRAITANDSYIIYGKPNGSIRIIQQHGPLREIFQGHKSHPLIVKLHPAPTTSYIEPTIVASSDNTNQVVFWSLLDRNLPCDDQTSSTRNKISPSMELREIHKISVDQSDPIIDIAWCPEYFVVEGMKSAFFYASAVITSCSVHIFVFKQSDRASSFEFFNSTSIPTEDPFCCLSWIKKSTGWDLLLATGSGFLKHVTGVVSSQETSLKVDNLVSNIGSNPRFLEWVSPLDSESGLGHLIIGHHNSPILELRWLGLSTDAVSDDVSSVEHKLIIDSPENVAKAVPILLYDDLSRTIMVFSPAKSSIALVPILAHNDSKGSLGFGPSGTHRLAGENDADRLSTNPTSSLNERNLIEIPIEKNSTLINASMTSELDKNKESFLGIYCVLNDLISQLQVPLPQSAFCHHKSTLSEHCTIQKQNEFNSLSSIMRNLSESRTNRNKILTESQNLGDGSTYFSQMIAQAAKLKESASPAEAVDSRSFQSALEKSLTSGLENKPDKKNSIIPKSIVEIDGSLAKADPVSENKPKRNNKNTSHLVESNSKSNKASLGGIFANISPGDQSTRSKNKFSFSPAPVGVNQSSATPAIAKFTFGEAPNDSPNPPQVNSGSTTSTAVKPTFEAQVQSIIDSESFKQDLISRIAESLKPSIELMLSNAVEQTLRTVFLNTVIPSYTRATQEMASQINDNVNHCFIQFTNTVQTSIKDTVAENVNSAMKQFSGLNINGQNQALFPQLDGPMQHPGHINPGLFYNPFIQNIPNIQASFNSNSFANPPIGQDLNGLNPVAQAQMPTPGNNTDAYPNNFSSQGPAPLPLHAPNIQNQSIPQLFNTANAFAFSQVNQFSPSSNQKGGYNLTANTQSTEPMGELPPTTTNIAQQAPFSVVNQPAPTSARPALIQKTASSEARVNTLKELLKFGPKPDSSMPGGEISEPNQQPIRSSNTASIPNSNLNNLMNKGLQLEMSNDIFNAQKVEKVVSQPCIVSTPASELNKSIEFNRAASEQEHPNNESKKLGLDKTHSAKALGASDFLNLTLYPEITKSGEVSALTTAGFEIPASHPSTALVASEIDKMLEANADPRDCIVLILSSNLNFSESQNQTSGISSPNSNSLEAGPSTGALVPISNNPLKLLYHVLPKIDINDLFVSSSENTSRIIRPATTNLYFYFSLLYALTRNVQLAKSNSNLVIVWIQGILTRLKSQNRNFGSQFGWKDIDFSSLDLDSLESQIPATNSLRLTPGLNQDIAGFMQDLERVELSNYYLENSTSSNYSPNSITKPKLDYSKLMKPIRKVILSCLSEICNGLEDSISNEEVRLLAKAKTLTRMVEMI